jgi:hypothetical protein
VGKGAVIHQSRKWRLVIRILALVLTSILMLAFAGPVSYALQDDTPMQISMLRELYDEKGQPIADSFADVEAVPDLLNVVRTGEGDSTHYWIPVQGYDHVLFVRTDKGKYLFPYDYSADAGFEHNDIVRFYGKVTRLEGQPDGEEALEALAAEGITVDKEEAMVLLQGEEPSIYRPMVPVMPLLALFWIVALAGAWQILRGRRPRTLRATYTGL